MLLWAIDLIINQKNSEVSFLIYLFSQGVKTVTPTVIVSQVKNFNSKVHAFYIIRNQFTRNLWLRKKPTLF